MKLRTGFHGLDQPQRGTESTEKLGLREFSLRWQGDWGILAGSARHGRTFSSPGEDGRAGGLWIWRLEMKDGEIRSWEAFE